MGEGTRGACKATEHIELIDARRSGDGVEGAACVFWGEGRAGQGRGGGYRTCGRALFLLSLSSSLRNKRKKVGNTHTHTQMVVVEEKPTDLRLTQHNVPTHTKRENIYGKRSPPYLLPFRGHLPDVLALHACGPRRKFTRNALQSLCVCLRVYVSVRVSSTPWHRASVRVHPVCGRKGAGGEQSTCPGPCPIHTKTMTKGGGASLGAPPRHVCAVPLYLNSARRLCVSGWQSCSSPAKRGSPPPFRNGSEPEPHPHTDAFSLSASLLPSL